MEIEGKIINQKNPTYFIADIAANHDGDLERAKDLIYLAAESGADAAKFQHFEAKTIVSDIGFKSLGKNFSHQAEWKKSVYEVYEEASVDWSWTEEIKNTCKKAKISFFTTPYSLEIVDFIDKYVPAYKIGSGDITWLPIIEKIAHKQKPYILATGASNFSDVINAVNCALKINTEFCIMQCNTNYTNNLENFKYINLNVLKTYKQMFPNVLLGLSDHTPGHATVLGAVALGAKMVEKHFTDDNSRNGPDHTFSMNPKSWKDMVNRTRELEAALGGGIKKVENNETETVILQRRSYRANKNMFKGHIIQKDDFSCLRPCPSEAVLPSIRIIGKTLTRSISLGDFIKLGDVI
tara:strand:- start:1303 stop:2355 length:1053 start_codon:yes stop_codon:yes gene_type:complete